MSTLSGGMPRPSVTRRTVVARSRARSSAAVARLSATTTSRSVPIARSAIPSAATRPLRIPGSSPIISSTSWGATLRPALMMRSLRRPVTKRSLSAT